MAREILTQRKQLEYGEENMSIVDLEREKELRCIQAIL